MLKISLFLLAILAMPGPASSGTTLPWKQGVQGWDIAIDTTIGMSCFMVSEMEDGTLLRLQFNAEDPGVQLILANARWTHLRGGESYMTLFALDGQSPWIGETTAHFWKGALPSLVLSVSSDDGTAHSFVQEFVAGGSLHLEHASTPVLATTVPAAGEALDEILKCQANMNEGARRLS